MVHSDKGTHNDARTFHNPTVVTPPTRKSGDQLLIDKIIAGDPPLKISASLDSMWDIFYDGDIYSFSYGELQENGITPGGLSFQELFHGAAQWEQNLLDFLEPPATGGRGGSRAPYVRPDERLVRSAIEGAWDDGLTGNVDKGGVNVAIKKFYADHRANYDNIGQQIDPMESVLEIIRATSKYKEIHQLRSESTSETDWISSKVGRLLLAGVSGPLAQELGEAQAQAGSGSDTVQQAGEIATQITTGRALQSHKAKIQQSMGAALGLL